MWLIPCGVSLSSCAQSNDDSGRKSDRQTVPGLYHAFLFIRTSQFLQKYITPPSSTYPAEFVVCGY